MNLFSLCLVNYSVRKQREIKKLQKEIALLKEGVYDTATTLFGNVGRMNTPEKLIAAGLSKAYYLPKKRGRPKLLENEMKHLSSSIQSVLNNCVSESINRLNEEVCIYHLLIILLPC